MTQGKQGKSGLGDRRFAVHSERSNAVERVRVLGEMDLSVVGLVDSELRRAEATDAKKIVLDLDELEFMDASGVRLLLDLNRRSKENGGRLRIRLARSLQVKRVLELTGVVALLPIVA